MYLYIKINFIFDLNRPDNKHQPFEEIVTGNVLEESHTMCVYFLMQY